MRNIPLLVLCCSFINLCNAQEIIPRFDRLAFFEIMASGNLKQIDAELVLLSNMNIADKEGYEGALLMRKAGLVTLPKDKLKYFKQGRIKMETILQADSARTEFRFLRLTIEEHAPKIVKYKSDIPRDKLYVKQHYKSTPQVVQHAISEYSKTSKVLHPDDL